MKEFKIEKGIAPPKRGPKPKITDYEAVIPLLPNMEVGDSIKIATVAETRRNSTYISVKGVLEKAFDKIPGVFQVSTIKESDGQCGVWIRKVAMRKPPR